MQQHVQHHALHHTAAHHTPHLSHPIPPPTPTAGEGWTPSADDSCDPAWMLPLTLFSLTYSSYIITGKQLLAFYPPSPHHTPSSGPPNTTIPTCLAELLSQPSCVGSPGGGTGLLRFP